MLNDTLKCFPQVCEFFDDKDHILLIFLPLLLSWHMVSVLSDESA